MLKKGDFELAPTTWRATEVNARFFNLSYPIVYLNRLYVVRSPRETLLMEMLKMASIVHWKIMICICAVVLSAKAQKLLENRLFKKQPSNSKFCRSCKSGQRSSSSNLFSNKLKIVLLGFGVVLLTRLYKASLLSTLLAPSSVRPTSERQIFQNIASKRLTMVVDRESYERSAIFLSYKIYLYNFIL